MSGSPVIGTTTDVITQVYYQRMRCQQEMTHINHWLKHLDVTEDDSQDSVEESWMDLSEYFNQNQLHIDYRQQERAARKRRRAIKERVALYHQQVRSQHARVRASPTPPQRARAS